MGVSWKPRAAVDSSAGPNVFKGYRLTTAEARLHRPRRMPCMRTLLACLFMALVPLQGSAAAARFCCLARGHMNPAMQSGSYAAHTAQTEQQLVRHA